MVYPFLEKDVELKVSSRYCSEGATTPRNVPKFFHHNQHQHFVADNLAKTARCFKVFKLKTQVICATYKVQLHINCFFIAILNKSIELIELKNLKI